MARKLRGGLTPGLPVMEIAYQGVDVIFVVGANLDLAHARRAEEIAAIAAGLAGEDRKSPGRVLVVRVAANAVRLLRL